MLAENFRLTLCIVGVESRVDLCVFVWSQIGLDRKAAEKAIALFLSDPKTSGNQIEFTKMRHGQIDFSIAQI
jgi:hypothetical protein